MPYRRILTGDDWSSLRHYIKDPAKAETIGKLVEANAQNVVLVESAFKDPGPDYSAVEIDGVEVYRIPGY